MADHVSSTGDDRVANNTMRHQYRVLGRKEKGQIAAIKDTGQMLADYIESLGSSREFSIALTKIEEAVMWAVKGVTK